MTADRKEAPCHLLEVDGNRWTQIGLDFIGYIDSTKEGRTVRRRDFRCRTCRAIVSFESERATAG